MLQLQQQQQLLGCLARRETNTKITACVRFTKVAKASPGNVATACNDHADVNTTLETVLLEANAIKITVVIYDRKNNELLKKT